MTTVVTPARLPRRACRLLLAVALVLGVASAVVPSARAAGALGPLTAAAAAGLDVTLDGADKSVSYTLPLTVPDTRTGTTSAGWSLTITSTQFAVVGSPLRTLPSTASSVTAVGLACQVSCSVNPANTITWPKVVPAGTTAPTAIKFFNAGAGSGRGTFTITPTIAVAVPANVYTGSYTSTITTTLVSGP